MDQPIGLCGDCRHAKTTRTQRGSEYLRCLLAAKDPRFAKYPRLPVLSCPGFERSKGSGAVGA